MLNNNQKQAVNCDAKRIAVVAAAGSGKTKVLIERIKRLVEDLHDPTRMLVLTFTNAAAKEMKARYQAAVSDGITPYFGTFHAFCYHLIIDDAVIRRQLGYSAIPNLAKPEDIKRIHGLAKAICGTKLSDAKLDMKRDEIAPKDLFEYDLFHKQIKKLLKSENLITFDIMCYDICNLFISNDICIRDYIHHYRYIFVDEFQDTDTTQWDFIKSFTDANLYVCGDPKQNLYSFRGTTSDVIKSLTKDPEWTTIYLTQNYRSTAQICNYANAIHNSWGNSPFNMPMVSDKSGIPVDVRKSFDFKAAKDVMEVVEDTASNETVAILCRSNREVAEVKDLFREYNVSFTSKPTAPQLPYLLHCAVDPLYTVEWLSSQLPAEEYGVYLRTAALADERISEAEFVNQYWDRFGETYKKIMDIRSLAVGSEPLAIWCALSNKYKMPITLAEALECNSVGDMVNKMLTAEESDTTESNLYVGTIHSSKGLEYDVVHLIGVNGKSFPTMANEDQMNCFYVACTRAKKKLVIWDESEDKKYDYSDYEYDLMKSSGKRGRNYER